MGMLHAHDREGCFIRKSPRTLQKTLLFKIVFVTIKSVL